MGFEVRVGDAVRFGDRLVQGWPVNFWVKPMIILSIVLELISSSFLLKFIFYLSLKPI